MKIWKSDGGFFNITQNNKYWQRKNLKISSITWFSLKKYSIVSGYNQTLSMGGKTMGEMLQMILSRVKFLGPYFHGMFTFHSEILASFFHKNKMLSPWLENNHTRKFCSGNFPTLSCMSRLLEKYQINIWTYGHFQIQGTRSQTWKNKLLEFHGVKIFFYRFSAQFVNFSAKFGSLDVQIRNDFQIVILIVCK